MLLAGCLGILTMCPDVNGSGRTVNMRQPIGAALARVGENKPVCHVNVYLIQ